MNMKRYFLIMLSLFLALVCSTGALARVYKGLVLQSSQLQIPSDGKTLLAWLWLWRKMPNILP